MVFEKIRDLVVEQLGIDADMVKPETKILRLIHLTPLRSYSVSRKSSDSISLMKRQRSLRPYRISSTMSRSTQISNRQQDRCIAYRIGTV